MLLASLALLIGTAALSAQEAVTPAEPSVVLVAPLRDTAITPVTVRFLERVIATAEEERAGCVVVVLDTPGGLVDSTRELVRAILGARLPVVVFVPAGGRAASAGVFVTLAAHVAAMAPGSNIGAAHPVRIGGLPVELPAPSEGEQAPAPPVMEEKAVQDTAAWARALADLRGRNRDWAERAVVESLSVTAHEALDQGVIDLVAADVPELLEALDGREVRLSHGVVTLATRGASVRTLELWWGERVLAAICDPNVAFLLLMFGLYGILFELHSPGWGVAGTLGAIALCLGFFALSVMPVDYVGLLLVFLAVGLFVAEAVVTSFGALAVGGIVCLVLGGLMLVDSPEGFLRVSLGVVGPVAAATALIVVLLVGNIVRAQRARVQTGTEAMIGEQGVATADFAASLRGYEGTVRTHGELWRAESPAPVCGGDELEVRERRGMTLIVAATGARTNERRTHAAAR